MNSDLQKSKGVAIDVNEAILRSQEYHHWISDYKIVKKYYEQSAQTINWLQSLGVKFADVLSMGPSYTTWHMYEGGGSSMVKVLVEKAQSLGATLILDAPGTEILMKDGKVSGIKSQLKNSKTLIIHAPVVILATGGYAGNTEMIQKYAGVAPDNIVDSGIAGRDGDGINMALAVGASDRKLKGTLMVFGPIMRGDTFLSDLQNMACYQGFMQVNEDAQRFVDESLPGINFTSYGNARMQQNKVYEIFTEEDMQRLISEGNPLTQTQPLTKLKEQMEKRAAQEPDRIFKADSVEALAEKTGLDKQALLNSVQVSNAACDLGKDEAFNKAKEYLTPLKKGPFYAYRVDLGYFTTADGLEVNENAQVLDSAGQWIPGLYAGGSDAAGISGDSYDVGVAPGSQQGWAVNSGSFAAEDAALYL